MSCFSIAEQNEILGMLITISILGEAEITSVRPHSKISKRRAGINLNPEEGSEIVHAIEFFAEMDEEELQRWSSSAFAYASSFFDKAALVKAYSRLFDI